MVEITNEITNITYVFVERGSSIAINKDLWDFTGIIGTAIAPITAIVFSIWNNLQIKKIRREDLAREEEMAEKSELRDHYHNINKFVDDQLYFLSKMTDQDFMDDIVKLQGLISKCGMITRDKTRDHMIYYISTYIEVAYFLLMDQQKEEGNNTLEVRAIFLNSIKEFDVLLINKNIDVLQQRIKQLIDNLKLVCSEKK